MEFGSFVRKNRKDWGEKWSFGAVCEKKKWDFEGKKWDFSEKSGIWDFVKKKVGFCG